MTRQSIASMLVRGLPALACAALLGCAGSPQPGPAAPTVPAAPASNRDFKVLGSETAPVTIIEFTDLQCPYCARFASQTFPKLRARYIDSGKVRFATTDLPLAMHAFAVPAAIAARCAGEQGRYWEYREKLFERQSELGTAPYAAIATAMGLDTARLEACRKDGRQLELVRADAARAATFGITSTPTFVIGRLVNDRFEGETISGAHPYETFAARIDALLASP